MTASTHPIHAQAAELVREQFEDGVRSVRLRAPTGTGMGIAAALVAAEEARRGRCLVLCPRIIQGQFEAELAAVAPDVRAGRWDSGASLVLADVLQVDRHARGAEPERFDAVVVEEYYPEQLPRIRAALARYPEARLLEISRMPRPHPGAFEAEVEIDLADEPNLSMAGPRR